MKNSRQIYVRWMVSVLGFPFGGLAAISVGTLHDGWGRAAVMGLIAGMVIGAAQWLAARPALTVWWLPATSIGLMVGAAVGTAITGAAHDSVSLVAYGVSTGVSVGAAQAMTVGVRVIPPWTLSMALSWAAAWVITSAVIVDIDRGYVIFGMSGALFATAICGVVLVRTLVPASREGAARS